MTASFRRLHFLHTERAPRNDFIEAFIEQGEGSDTILGANHLQTHKGREEALATEEEPKVGGVDGEGTPQGGNDLLLDVLLNLPGDDKHTGTMAVIQPLSEGGWGDGHVLD